MGNALDRTLKGKQSLLKAKFNLKGSAFRKGKDVFGKNKMLCREYFFLILNRGKIEIERKEKNKHSILSIKQE